MGMLISNEPDFMIHGVLKYQLFGPCGTGEPDPQKGNGPAGNISECAGDGL